MAEKHVVTIKGEAFNLPPFTAGQMRRQVDPVLKETAEILTQAQALMASADPSAENVLTLTIQQRRVACQQAELVLAALQNQYPHLTLDDVEALSPTRVSQVFNELLMLTTSGTNEPGEMIPPTQKRKR